MKKIIITTSVLFFTACAPTISNFNSYQKQPISKTAFMPDPEVIEGIRPTKVVVFNLDENDIQIAKQASLGSAVTANIENALTKDRLAKLVDRKSASKLEKEIALAEMNKTGSYKGPEIADYAISGTISNASFTKKYSSGGIYPNKDGSMTRVPPKFTYIGDISGNIKIYELPSMSVVENFEFSGKKSRVENVQSDNNVSIGGLVEFGGQQAKGIDRDDNLVRKAGEEAISDLSVDIKNFFARRGFILERRSLKSKSIFKINLGSSDGIAQGDKFEITGQYETENALTGKNEVERRIIAEGAVSDKIDPQTSWVIIDDNQAIENIRIGDSVKFKYKKSFFNKIGKLAAGAMD